jgi:hypothetical protein
MHFSSLCLWRSKREHQGHNLHTVLACKAVQTAFQTQPGFSLVRERINGMREAGIGEAKKAGRAGGVGR